MERKIEIILDNNKDILIKIDNKPVHTIYSNERQISADVIYSVLNPEESVTYRLMEYVKNEKFNKDNDVAKYFYDMIKVITNGITRLNESNKVQEEKSSESQKN